MEQVNLYNMIKYLQNGTNLHIGTQFFGNYGNEMCKLPAKHLYHYAPICEEIKTRNKKEYKKCYRCRNLALKKALTSQKAFGGICINGVYEYTHPVILNNEVVCVIFIGNILDKENGIKKLNSKITDKTELIDTMEKNLTYSDFETIGHLLENYILYLLQKYPYDTSDINPLIENIKNYIRSNLEFGIDIKRIADFFHYNKTYLGRLFKKETGMSISDYINLQRIEKAKLLLENTNESIINISEKIGYENVTYFNRVFKNALNITPTQYRNTL